MIDTTGTQPAVALAWSREEPPTEPEPPVVVNHTWPAVVARAVVLVVSATCLAVAIAHLTGHRHSTLTQMPTPTTQVAAPPSAVQTPVPTPTVAPAPQPQLPDADPLTVTDHTFLAQLDRDGIPKRKAGTDGSAITTALAICRTLDQGDTPAHVQSVMTERYLTLAQAKAYIADAVAFYCPHNY